MKTKTERVDFGSLKRGDRCCWNGRTWIKIEDRTQDWEQAAVDLKSGEISTSIVNARVHPATRSKP